jgi:hypothetical protein
MRFIVKKTLACRNKQENKQPVANTQKPPNLPKSLRNLIQLE